MIDPGSATLAAAGLKVVVDIISKSRSPRPGRQIVLNASEHQDTLRAHAVSTHNWASRIPFKAAMRPFSEVAIALDVYDGDERRPTTKSTSVDPLTLLSTGQHAVILGGPGAGKTTLLKHLCLHVQTTPSTTDTDKFAIPLLVTLREMASNELLTTRLLATLGIHIDLDPPIVTDGRAGAQLPSSDVIALTTWLAGIRERCLLNYLNACGALVLLDGLDELPLETTTRIAQEIGRLNQGLQTATTITTCRHGAYATVIPGALCYSVRPFTEEQVADFATRWLRSPESGAQFIESLKRVPYHELASIPIHATSFCVLFESYGTLPQEHIRVYEKVVDTRVREWDRERGVIRPSAQADFGPDEKRRFLSHLAFELCKSDQALSFETGVFKRAFEVLRGKFYLEAADPRDVLAELEGHTGLIYESGFERYEFLHKTLQEYLCGEYISRVPIVPEYHLFLRNMPDACALGTMLSYDPDSFVWCLWSAIFSKQHVGTSGTEAVAAFWTQYFMRLTSERASFRGHKILGAALCNAMSYCATGQHSLGARYVPEELSENRHGRSLLNAFRSVLSVPGVQEGIDALMAHATAKDAYHIWGDSWAFIVFDREIGYAETIGKFQYPRALVVPGSISEHSSGR